mmetsp:Transcript_37042/g.109205  ORF Transcript_37042/g.109205 Transcript_37042/m.109205 type:complete len:86 (+) Transcript_37042:562-819(+)|eukprot:360059-Chlamydomonas_euryale.AAC.4
MNCMPSTSALAQNAAVVDEFLVADAQHQWGCTVAGAEMADRPIRASCAMCQVLASATRWEGHDATPCRNSTGAAADALGPPPSLY